jgi:hypothetical protein
MSKQIYSLFGRWREDNTTPATIGARFLDTLDQIGPLGPAMNNWLLLDLSTAEATMAPLARARPRIAEWVLNNVVRDGDGEPDPSDGYALFARGGEVESEFGSSRSINVDVRAGSQWRSNQASFAVGDLSRPPDRDLVTYPIYRGALEVLASVWPLPWMEAYAYAPNFPPLEPATFPPTVKPLPPRENYNFPWILYLSAPLAAGLKPPAALICDPTPGGGVVLSVVRDRLDPENPDHVRRSRLLQAIMDERVGEDEPPDGVGAASPPPRVGPF